MEVDNRPKPAENKTENPAPDAAAPAAAGLGTGAALPGAHACSLATQTAQSSP